MKPSARLAEPPSAVSETIAAPGAPSGVNAVTVVEFTTTMLVASTPPIVTLDVPVRFAPVIVIAVAPTVEPLLGETDEIVGGEAD